MIAQIFTIKIKLCTQTELHIIFYFLQKQTLLHHLANISKDVTHWW